MPNALSSTCDAVAAQMQDAAICARRGDARAAYVLMESAIEMLRCSDFPVGQKFPRVPAMDSTNQVRGALPAWRARRVVEHIDLHLGDSISVKELASIAGFSTGHFCRAFKARFRVTVHRYITGRRMQMARHYLLTTSHCITEIALRCGMTDQSHLTRVFSRVFGEPPARWRSARTYMRGRLIFASKSDGRISR